MSGVIFTYQGAGGQRTLSLRHGPYNVNWTYNLNTQPYDTFGGQVIQVLSINIDRLVIEGQFGREGAFGYSITRGADIDPRWGGRVPAGGRISSDITEQFNYQGNNFPGLHAMVEFFREYFAQASQGNDADISGRFNQNPITLSYAGAPTHDNRVWKVIPTDLPSFRRSNDNFAPEWRVECSVIQADSNIAKMEQQAALTRLQDAVGYTVKNPFSDPLADPDSDASSATEKIVNQFRAILPNITMGDLENMVWQDISIPNIEAGKSIPTPSDLEKEGAAERYNGEVGFDAPKPVEATQAGKTYQDIFVEIASGDVVGGGASGGAGGANMGNWAPGEGLPSQYAAQVAAQAPALDNPAEGNPIKAKFPGCVPPTPGKQYYGALMDEGRVFGVGHYQDGNVEPNCSTLAPHIHIKYRNPPGAGNTTTVYI